MLWGNNVTVAMQTLGALAHFDFNSPGSYSYEQAYLVMQKLSLGQAEAEQLFRRMVFNVAARNNDDHVKNISFLMDRQGQWRLSPDYDVTYAYDPKSFWLRAHQMTISGKIDGITPQDLIQTGRYMNISKRTAVRIMEEVQSAVLKWKEYAEKAGVPEKEMTEIRSNIKKI